MQWTVLVIFSLSPILLVYIASLKEDAHEPIHDVFSQQLWNCYDIILILCFFLLIRAFNWLLVWKDIISASQVNSYGTLIFLVVPCIAFYFIFRKKYSFTPSELGLCFKNCTQKIIIGLRVFFLLAFLQFMIAFLIGSNRLFFEGSRWFYKFKLLEMQLDQLFVFCFSILIVAPIVEESIFRGAMYGPLSRKFGHRGSIVLTALIWAFWHNNIKSFAGVFIAGIILSYVYANSQSVIPNTVIHILHNFTSFITFLYLWLFQKGILQFERDKFIIFIILFSFISFVILSLVSKKITVQRVA
jgi:membrane protease YdiL (CAAX protease family)